MENLNLKLVHKIEHSADIFTEMVTMNPDKALIYERLYELIEALVKVDT